MEAIFKRLRVVETVAATFCGTKNKAEQKKNVVIALGDGDLRGNMRGMPSILSTAWVKHLKWCTTVVFVNEFRTSKLCSECHSELLQQRKCFTVKRRLDSVCSLGFENRDVNAIVNILYLFLWTVSTMESHIGTSAALPRARAGPRRLGE